jgi:hypothetical protein
VTVRFILLALLLLPVARAAELKPETQKAWESYIAAANLRMRERLDGRRPFLWMDEAPNRSRRASSGEVVVAAIGEQNPLKVRNGLIHDWIGAAFFPNAKLTDALAVVQDYKRYKDFYAPVVIDSEALGHAGQDYRFSMLMMNSELFSRVAIHGEYKDSYFPLDERRWYSAGYSTKVQEIENYGRPDQHELPPGEGSGYIWRLYSFSRFEQRDGGIYVEIEAIALSRDIPGSVRWLVDPIVRRIAKSSLVTSLQLTRKAVETSVAERDEIVASAKAPGTAANTRAYRAAMRMVSDRTH